MQNDVHMVKMNKDMGAKLFPTQHRMSKELNAELKKTFDAFFMKNIEHGSMTFEVATSTMAIMLITMFRVMEVDPNAVVSTLSELTKDVYEFKVKNPEAK